MISLLPVVSILFAIHSGSTAGSQADDASVAPWAKQSVTRMMNAGILRGDPNGAFHGARTAIRFHAMLTLKRMLRQQDLHVHRTTGRDLALLNALTPVASERTVGLRPLEMFKDLEDPCFSELSGFWVLTNSGILQGFPDVYFRGKRPLKRRELAVICSRVLLFSRSEPPMDAEKAHFSDLAGDEWYYGAVVVACGSGMMQGNGDHTFRGNQVVSRNELAVTVDRLSTMIGR